MKLMPSRVDNSLKCDVDEYLFQIQFKNTFKSWLSSSNSGGEVQNLEHYETKDICYDTDELDMLLWLNGLKNDPNMVLSWSPIQASFCHSPPQDVVSKDPPDLPSHKRRSRFSDLYHRFKSSLHGLEVHTKHNLSKPELESPHDDPWNSVMSPTASKASSDILEDPAPGLYHPDYPDVNVLLPANLADPSAHRFEILEQPKLIQQQTHMRFSELGSTNFDISPTRRFSSRLYRPTQKRADPTIEELQRYPPLTRGERLEPTGSQSTNVLRILEGACAFCALCAATTTPSRQLLGLSADCRHNSRLPWNSVPPTTHALPHIPPRTAPFVASSCLKYSIKNSENNLSHHRKIRCRFCRTVLSNTSEDLSCRLKYNSFTHRICNNCSTFTTPTALPEYIR